MSEASKPHNELGTWYDRVEFTGRRFEMASGSKPHIRQDVQIIRRVLEGEGIAQLALANLEQQFQRLEEQLEALRKAAIYAEDELRKWGHGSNLIGARHRLRDALNSDSNPASEPPERTYFPYTERGRPSSPASKPVADARNNREFPTATGTYDQPDSSPAKTLTEAARGTGLTSGNTSNQDTRDS